MLKNITNALQALPRDSRDTLFLLVVVGWVVMPQASNLPLWCVLLTAGVLLWRGLLALRNRPLPSAWWLGVLLAVTVAATFYTHRTLLGRDAGGDTDRGAAGAQDAGVARPPRRVRHLLSGLLHDAHQLLFLAVAGHGGGDAGGTPWPADGAGQCPHAGGKPSLWVAARTAGWMALLGAPIMAVLFLLFPRMAPLWGIPSDGLTGRSGLTSSMQVGNIAKLALDESIAMRVKFDGPVPAQSDLYFRGPVLSTFDGREWRPLQSSFLPRFQTPSGLQVLGTPVRYEVTLEPNNRPWVFLLEAAGKSPELPGYEVKMTADLQWLATRPITDLVRYRAESHTDFRHGPERQAVQLQDYIELPAGFNPRTLALAAEMRRDPRLSAAPASVLVSHVLDRLRTGGYSYTLEPGVYGDNTADEFWFDRKEGFCEHIASAFVVLMRALDVPARVVTGYQGGQRNNVDGFWTIRQSDAHAWTEVWEAGLGWVRVDPTSAVAPAARAASSRCGHPRGRLPVLLPVRLAPSARTCWPACARDGKH